MSKQKALQRLISTLVIILLFISRGLGQGGTVQPPGPGVEYKQPGKRTLSRLLRKINEEYSFHEDADFVLTFNIKNGKIVTVENLPADFYFLELEKVTETIYLKGDNYVSSVGLPKPIADQMPSLLEGKVVRISSRSNMYAKWYEPIYSEIFMLSKYSKVNRIVLPKNIAENSANLLNNINVKIRKYIDQDGYHYIPPLDTEFDPIRLAFDKNGEAEQVRLPALHIDELFGRKFAIDLIPGDLALSHQNDFYRVPYFDETDFVLEYDPKTEKMLSITVNEQAFSHAYNSQWADSFYPDRIGFMVKLTKNAFNGLKAYHITDDEKYSGVFQNDLFRCIPDTSFGLPYLSKFKDYLTSPQNYSLNNNLQLMPQPIILWSQKEKGRVDVISGEKIDYLDLHIVTPENKGLKPELTSSIIFIFVCSLSSLVLLL